MNFLPQTAPTRTAQKLESFRHLQAGWHYGRGGPIADGQIARARDVYGRFLDVGLARTEAFAGADGEIQITACRRGHYVAVTVEPDGFYTLSYEAADQAEEADRREEGLEQPELRRALGEVAKAIWGMYDSSTQITSIATAGGLLTSPSNALLTAVCQYSIETVPKEQAA